MEKRRYSSQRELIYNCLKDYGGHPTAEIVYQKLKPEHPRLSLSTVYRNLNQMAESGLITRLPFRVDRYDAIVSPHAHFCCEVCGAVCDMELPGGETDLDGLSAATGLTIRRETRCYFGVCRACGNARE